MYGFSSDSDSLFNILFRYTTSLSKSLKYTFLLCSLLKELEMKQSLTQLLKPETSTLFSEPPSLLLLCEITRQVLLFLLNISTLSVPTASILIHTSPELWKKLPNETLDIFSFSPSLYNSQCDMSQTQTWSYLSTAYSPWMPRIIMTWHCFSFKSHFILLSPWQTAIQPYWISFSSEWFRLCFIYRMLHKYLLYLEHSPLILYLANCHSPLGLTFDDTWNLALRLQWIPFLCTHSSYALSYQFTSL